MATARICAVLILASTSCVVRYSAPLPPPGPAAPPPPRASNPAGAHGLSPAAETECGAPIAGLDQVAHPGALILFADLPGTEEIPQFVGEAACHQAISGIQVVIGLEIPRDEQQALEAFLEGPGKDEDRARLLGRGFWRRANQDGRSSVGTMELLEYARELKANHRPVTAFAYDEPSAQGAERDAAMARNISAWREHHPSALFLVLSGSAHVSMRGPRSWEDRMPMAVHLRKIERWLVTLTPGYEGGWVWSCLGPDSDRINCGVHPVYGRYTPSRPHTYLPGPGDVRPEHDRFVSLWRRPSPDGYQGVYFVGPLSASPPAIESEKREVHPGPERGAVPPPMPEGNQK